jgi:hypothetical protein
MKSTCQKQKGLAKEIHPSLENKSFFHTITFPDVQQALSSRKILRCSLPVKGQIAFEITSLSSRN